MGTGEEISIKKLAELISYHIGFEGKIVWDRKKPDGTPRKKLCVKKINKLGWESKINLNQGIQNTIKCFFDEREKGILRK